MKTPGPARATASSSASGSPTAARYEEYLKEVVNPKDRDRDRRWLSATIDLSAYEGQLVEINLNTDPGPPSDDEDRRNDFALWGEPRVIGH